MRQGSDCGAVLLDRHPLWLVAVEDVLSRMGVTVLGKATTGDDALELLAAHEAELLVVDLEAVGDAADQVHLLRHLRARFEHVRVIVLSEDDPQRISAALHAGALAYVAKTAHPDDLATAIRQVFAHSIYFSGAWIASALGNGTTNARAELTRREAEILMLVAEGHSNGALAQMLWVTEQTIKFHLSNIYRKLGVANRTEASRWAQMHALLPEKADPAGLEGDGPADEQLLAGSAHPSF